MTAAPAPRLPAAPAGVRILAGTRSTPGTTITALPAPVNLAVYAGDDFALNLTVTDENGLPYDLTGATPKAQIRATPADVDILAELACWTNANVITVALASADSAGLTPRAAWDCQITTADGYVYTLAAGTVTTTAQVTR